MCFRPLGNGIYDNRCQDSTRVAIPSTISVLVALTGQTLLLIHRLLELLASLIPLVMDVAVLAVVALRGVEEFGLRASRASHHRVWEWLWRCDERLPKSKHARSSGMGRLVNLAEIWLAMQHSDHQRGWALEPKGSSQNVGKTCPRRAAEGLLLGAETRTVGAGSWAAGAAQLPAIGAHVWPTSGNLGTDSKASLTSGLKIVGVSVGGWVRRKMVNTKSQRLVEPTNSKRQVAV